MLKPLNSTITNITPVLITFLLQNFIMSNKSMSMKKFSVVHSGHVRDSFEAYSENSERGTNKVKAQSINNR